MRRMIRTIGKLTLAACFALAISAAPLGCNEPTHGDEQQAGKCCNSPTCCKTANKCPAGCTKPCCKKA